MRSIFFPSLILIAISWTTSSARNTTPAPAPAPKIWALLTAGSNGWFNYRHQADVCHAYQILRKHGIPEENIIVMMYDDIANNSQNPNPGVIFNEPNGPNVYEGVVKDYTGQDVTPKNFLNILLGKKKLMAGIGSGKVIESGPNDIIFVNFVDHGAQEMLGFPNDVLSADELSSTLKIMTAKKSFSKMFLFIEACESGSMFQNFVEENTNIFVMTAADTKESSWACYCDQNDTCLGDLFSVNWMHQAEIEPLTNTSAHHLFEKVRAATLTSHVEEFGDLDIGNITNAKIIGESDRALDKKSRHFIDPNLSVARQNEAKLVSLQNALGKALKLGNQTEVRRIKKLLTDETHRRLTHMRKMDTIITKMTGGNFHKIKILETAKPHFKANVSKCYKTVLKEYFSNCLNFAENEFVYPSLKYFWAACSVKWTNTEKIINAVHSVCQAE